MNSIIGMGIIRNGLRVKHRDLLFLFWFLFLCLWVLSYTSVTEWLRGVRIGHQIYYIEFLYLPAALSILIKPRRVKIPLLLYVFGFYITVLGVYGALEGHSLSHIYDRYRNWLSFILLLMLFYRFEVTSLKLERMTIPVLIACVIGYPLAMLFPKYGDGGVIQFKDSLGFNCMAAAYAIGCFVTKRKARLWHVAAILAAPIIPLYLASRAKFLAIVSTMFIPVIRGLYKSFFRSVFFLIVLGVSIYTVSNVVGSSDQSKAKAISSGGLEISALTHSASSRLVEVKALDGQMSGLQYLFGKGAAAIWDGKGIYDGVSGEERTSFHIYYFEIFYFYGAIGIIMWFLIGIYPLIRGFLDFYKLNAIGIMGLISQASLMLAWFGHAGYTLGEGAYMAISIYAIHVGRK